MKTKKHVVFILTTLLVLLVLFVGCGAKGEPDALPADADPTPTETPAPTPEPTPDPDERMHFDDLVTQYESSNDIDLNTSDNSIQEEFFGEIYMQNYTKTDALEDKAEVSKGNAALLDKYLTFLDNFQHTECGFDVAVNEFMSHYGEWYGSENYTEEEKLELLYTHISGQLIFPEDIEQWDCHNEYAQGYINWYNTNYPSANTATPQPPLTQEEIEEWRQRSADGAKRMEEESAQRAAENQQWMEENFDLYGY